MILNRISAIPHWMLVIPAWILVTPDRIFVTLNRICCVSGVVVFDLGWEFYDL